MTLAVLLAFGGLLLVYTEFFVPGGILGGISILFFIGSVVAFFYASHNSLWGVGYVIALTSAIVWTIRFALVKVRQTGANKTIFLDDDQAGYFASSYPKQFLGESGISLTSLRPSGYIMVARKRFQAVSRIGYIKKGTRVTVVGGDGSHLIVREQSSDSEQLDHDQITRE